MAIQRIPFVAAVVSVALVAAPFGAAAKSRTVAQAVSDDAITKPANTPCISWINPLLPPRALVLCIHGLGLYSNAYKTLGETLSRRGINTYAMDVRGFGSWLNAKGQEQIDFDACLNDVKNVVQTIRTAHPGIPLFVLGESMGGAIALRAASLFPELISGVISAVPAGDRFQQKKTDLNVALHMLAGKNKQFDIGKKIVNQATTDESLKQRWENDPLDRMDLSPKELIQFQSFMNDNHDAVKKITNLPVLIVQGCQDRLVKPEGTVELFNEIPTDQKDLFMFGKEEHLIFEELDKPDDSIKLLTLWIETHLPDFTPPAVNGPSLLGAISDLVAGQTDSAKQTLEAFVKLHPMAVEGHYWLGVAYMKLGRAQLARQQFIRVRFLDHGNTHAKEANSYLLSLPSRVNSSNQTSSGDLLKTLSTNELTSKLVSPGKPSVLAFYASWCDECSNLDHLFSEAKTLYGDKVNLVKIDVDDSRSADLLAKLNIGPIPTLVYLTPSARVSSFSVGSEHLVNLAGSIRSLLPQN